MMSFKDNFFFVKFSVLFFIVTIFGYWGIDLNSEELYIAFSFFFLVIVAFVTIRTSMLMFFLNTVNRKYLRLLTDLNRIRLILKLRAGIFSNFTALIRSRKERVAKFLTFNASFLPELLALTSQLYLAHANKLFISLAVNLNFFVLNNIRARRVSGFFENSSRFFSISA